MSEVLAKLEKKGGALKDSTLWTNANPASAFAYQEVTLSDSIDNYDFIAFYYRGSTSNSTESFIIVSVDEFKKSSASTTITAPRFMMAFYITGDGGYDKPAIYSSPTKVLYGTSYKTGASTYNNGMIIPTRIVGLKY